MLAKLILRFLAATVSVFIAVTLFQPLALSQDAPVAPPTNCTDTKAELPEPHNATLWAEAIARAFAYDYQYLEQPNRVVVQNGTGSAQLVPNPNYSLNQHTFSLDLSQMFVSTDMTTALKMPPHKCSTVRGVPRWKRGVSGLTLKVSLAEHPRAVMNTLLPPGQFLQNYNVGGEADFDPAKIFYDFSSPTRDSNPSTIDYLAELVPKVVFKRVTPFDFVKYGGQLIPAATQNGLNTIELTWDARRILRQRKPVAGQGTGAKQKLCILWNPDGPNSYISVPDSADAMFCKHLTSDLGALQFQLGCASDKGAEFGKEIKKGEPLDGNALPKPDACNWKVGAAKPAPRNQ